MKEASACRADDVRVNECLFVKVRNASGRRVAGGRMIGRIAAFGGLTLNGLNGWTGVPNAGDDDGMADDEGMTFCRRKMGAGVLSIVASFDASGVLTGNQSQGHGGQ